MREIISCIICCILIMSVPIHEFGHYVTSLYFGLHVFNVHLFWYFDNNTWENPRVTVGIPIVSTVVDGVTMSSVHYNYTLITFMGFALVQIVCLFLFWLTCFSLSLWLCHAVGADMLIMCYLARDDFLHLGVSLSTQVLLFLSICVVWLAGSIYIIKKLESIKPEIIPGLV